MENCMINPPDDYDDGRAYEEEEDPYEAERLEFEAAEAHTRLWAGEDVYDMLPMEEESDIDQATRRAGVPFYGGVKPMPIINEIQTRKKTA